MKLEGSRHEKIIITIAAYVIGLNTAFIAFGITEVQINNFVYDDIESDISDEVPSVETPETTTDVSEDPVTSVSTIKLDEQGLSFINEAKSQLITANRASVISAVLPEEPKNGLHEAVHGVVLSSDESFVYYCEQLTEALECEPFVYDTVTNTVHRVALPSGETTLAVGDHQATWRVDGRLKVANFISSSITTPWK